MASRSGSEEKKPRRQTKQQAYESEGEESETYAPPQRRRNQRQQRGGPLDNLALDNVQQTAGGLVNTATGALGGVAGQAVDQKGGGGKSDTLRLRLDLNLDVEITLKAKIHGDLELALFVEHLPRVSRLAQIKSDYQNAINYLAAMTSRIRRGSQEGGNVDGDGEGASKQPQQQHTPERPRSPAYVAPIPQIPSIPAVSSGEIGIQVPTAAERPQLSPLIGSLLVGKSVDEYGDIVDDKTGHVLARAGGDLPSIVGRRVSNAAGDILGDGGELLGYVAEVKTEKLPAAAAAAGNGGPRSLFDVMGRSRASLMVDHLGNIIDAEGNVVGKFHDNNNPLHRKERGEREAAERLLRQQQKEEKEGEEAASDAKQNEGQHDGKEQQSMPVGGQPRPRRTEEERRQNAEAWRKENPSESPSDIFLDVKSTRDGIQLTIRIPTVFNGQQRTPNITFS
ncbi:hypothetical protein N656DRAFT_842715 [Canariomyces notabilis]|uniref:Uncharacterized protein n=1 Tax=Canariomyces notabilis TaxID=2074819 RepID=A0AAN6TKV0_9PEZI|nr:hypothetical protein N656DRAFT_842715 [Canariomyces arenarius]